MTIIFVSRFLIKLQAANLRTVGANSSQHVSTIDDRSLKFGQAIGSLGASLSPEDYLEDADENGGNYSYFTDSMI